MSLKCILYSCVWKNTHTSLLSVNTAVVVRFPWTRHKHCCSPHWYTLLKFSKVWVHNLKLLYVDVRFIIKTLYWWILFTPFCLSIDFMYLRWSFRPKSLMCPVIYSFTMETTLTTTTHYHNCRWAASQSCIWVTECVCVCFGWEWKCGREMPKSAGML